MPVEDSVRAVLSLVLVLGGIGVLALLLKLLQQNPRLGQWFKPATQAHRHLQVVETLILDARRRVVLLRIGTQTRAVLLGPSSETVLETDVALQNTQDKEAKLHVV